MLSALSRFIGCERANVATIFALALPALCVIATGAVDLSSVYMDYRKMQAVADAAALSAAKELGVDSTWTTGERAQAFAKVELENVARRWSLQVSADVLPDGKGVHVSIAGSRESLFHDLLPKGGWHVSVGATALAENRMPLCILGFDTGQAGVVNLKDTSQISAPACLIQSNNDLEVGGAAHIEAGAASAVGDATGPISPSPQTGAAPIPDPFASLDVSVPDRCDDSNLVFEAGEHSLPPGVHCGNITVEQGAVLTLEPGEHYFSNGELTVRDSAKISGKDVVLIFNKENKLDFQGDASIALEGRTSGPYAGFVIATERGNSKDFTISASSARELLGVIYIPDGSLTVSGDKKVADASAWTVVIAKGVRLNHGSNLVINTNYQGADVPVPTGVGPREAEVHLVN